MNKFLARLFFVLAPPAACLAFGLLGLPEVWWPLVLFVSIALVSIGIHCTRAEVDE